MEQNSETTKYLCGEFYVDVLTGPDCDGGREVRKVSDVSFSIRVGEKFFSMNLRGYKDTSGQTIEQALLKQSNDLAELIKKQEALEEVQA